MKYKYAVGTYFVKGEDSYSFTTKNDRGIGVVADGIGSCDYAKLASQIAVKEVTKKVINDESLEEAVLSANHKIKIKAKDLASNNMGTTIVAATIVDGEYTICWAGDSRAYIWNHSENKLKQVTKDHSFVQMYVDAGALSPKDASHHKYSNIILQYLGTLSSELKLGIKRGKFEETDSIILCSDGLNNTVSYTEISELLSEKKSLQEFTDNLITRSIQNNAKDDVTIIIIEREIKKLAKNT